MNRPIKVKIVEVPNFKEKFSNGFISKLKIIKKKLINIFNPILKYALLIMVFVSKGLITLEIMVS